MLGSENDEKDYPVAIIDDNERKYTEQDLEKMPRIGMWSNFELPAD